MSAIFSVLNMMTNSICTMLNIQRMSASQTIEDNKKYVPKEILDQAFQNTNIQEDNPMIVIDKNYEVKTYKCGCIFKTAIKGGFGYSNHWCEKHAPRGTFDMPNIPKQTTKVTEGSL